MSVDHQLDESTLPLESSETGVEDPVKSKDTGYLGTLLKGRYLIEKRLGRGGVGVVYLARDTQLMSKPVVVKVLHLDLDQPEHLLWFKKKFQQEIEALARLDHPGIIGVLDAGEMDNGQPYLIVQYVEGVTLRAAITPGGMEFALVASIMRQAGNALSAAHEKGIFHRDLKPENIMLQRLGSGEELVKVIDFGIATVKDSQFNTARNITRAAGTLPYMAPEQLRGHPVAASDVYALGVVAYEMLTGQAPFQPETPVQLYELQKSGPELAPRELRPDLPVAAQAAILKALAFDPQTRFASAQAFGEALGRGLGRAKRAALTTAGAKTAVEAQRQTASVEPGPPTVEIAYVLAIKIIAHSSLPMEDQQRLLRQLQEIVRQTTPFQRAPQQVVSLSAPDGLTLAFFRPPMAAAQCAMEVARQARALPYLPLRMGVHCGPVYRLADISAQRQVAGDGVNLAHQAMELGDASHILLTQTAADVLRQLGDWASHLTDLGEREFPSGVRVHLFNLCTPEAGNPELPEKFRAAALTTSLASAASRDERGKRRLAIIAACLVLVLLVGALAIFQFRQLSATPTVPVSSPTQPAQHLFSYWMAIEKFRNQRLDQPRIQSGSEVVFGQGDGISVYAVAPRAGYLYVLNEGPEPRAGRPSYNLLFPEQQESPYLTSNRQIRIPSRKDGVLQFDQRPGTEKLWFVWSADKVAALDEAARATAANGSINDPAHVKNVVDLLATYAANKPEVKVDDESKQAQVMGKGGVVIHLVKLHHY